jgi:hypothetical protein
MKLKDIIRKELIITDLSTNQSIAIELNSKPLIENPEPISQVPRGIKSILECRSLVTSEEFDNLLLEAGQLYTALTALSRFFNIPEGEPTKEDKLFVLSALGLSEKSISNIEELSQTLEDDPNYKPLIESQSIAEKYNLGLVTPEDVQEALNS